jgi:hypothetical protein
MRAEILSPVHVGTGDSVPKFELALRREGSGGTLYRLSMAAALRGAPDPRAFETDAGIHSYVEALNASGPPDEGITMYSIPLDDSALLPPQAAGGGGALAAALAQAGLGQDRTPAYNDWPEDYRPCAKAGFAPILPGSSLKGALLTGCFYGRFLAAQGPQNAWGRARAALEGGANPGKEGLSKRLQPPDICFPDGAAVYNAVRVLGSRNRPLQLWVEALLPAHTGQGQLPRHHHASGLSLASRPLSQSDVIAICEGCNELAQAILEHETRFFSRCRQRHGQPLPALYALGALAVPDPGSTQCLARVGWGVGMHSTSVKLLDQRWLQNDPQKPKSRWLIGRPDGNGRQRHVADPIPLGWVRVTFSAEDGDFV